MMNVLSPDDDYDDDDDEHSYACSSSSLTVGKSPSPAVSSPCFGKSKADMDEEDAFYHKLDKLNEPSGLSLLFDFRDTSMDLHEFYKIVTQRGGYHQVTKEGKWEDIASGLNRINRVTMTATQLLKLYATILYPFEQTYHYRSPVKHIKTPIAYDIPLESRVSNFGSGEAFEGRHLNSTIGKRKHDDGLYTTPHHLSNRETPYKKLQYNRCSWKPYPVGMTAEKKPVLGIPAIVKATRKDSSAPHGSRNCYQIFMKMEYDRLKSIHGDSLAGQMRDMIVEKWNRLSDDDKQPFIEASKKDKKRYLSEMVAYEEHKRTQRNQMQMTTQKVIKFQNPTLVEFPTPLQEIVGCSHETSHHDVRNQKVDFHNLGSMQIDRDYHVALQPHDDHEIAQVSNHENVIKFPDPTLIDFATPFQEIVGGAPVTSQQDVRKQKVADFGKSGSMQIDGDYHVALEPDDGQEIELASNESMVQRAVGLMKNAPPNDPIFQIDWDA